MAAGREVNRDNSKIKRERFKRPKILKYNIYDVCRLPRRLGPHSDYKYIEKQSEMVKAEYFDAYDRIAFD